EDTTESVTWGAGLSITGVDAYGAYWDVGLTDGAARVGFIVHQGDLKDPGPDLFLVLGTHGREIWLVSGSDRIYTAPPLAPPAEGVARVHYVRPDGDYEGWTLHVWEDTVETVTWVDGLPITGFDDLGAYWDVRLTDGAARLGFIVHRGDEKDPGPDQFLEFDVLGNEAWVVSGNTTVFGERPDLRVAGGGDLRARRAYWVARDLILWDVGVPLAGSRYRLHHADAGGLALDEGRVVGGAALPLAIDPDGPPAEVLARFPHLAGLTALRLPPDAGSWVRTLLRGQVAVSMSDADDALLDATGLQVPGVLDDLFATDAPLGVHWDGDVPTLSVWAPTARVVRLVLFDGDEERVVPMRSAFATGVWSIVGEPSWRGRDYLYEVEVYAPSTDRIETNRVTDPYSLSLRANSARSQVVDLADPALMPAGWTDLVKAPLADPVDAVVYELHVRDFSVADASVPADLRGAYAAFGLPDTAGVRHLTALAEAGVTHLHLLPTFDLATIDEDRSAWLEPDLGPDGRPSAPAAAQEAVAAVRDRDGFNWGYDPWHYLVPEGSYATDPDGPARVLEFRELVMALDRMGLKVVVDVVFNHTNAAGQSERSVLDRIVPGYYHRLDEAGNVTTSTCCQNTATEHAMMERLMLDAVALWARAYKVDGYRFDLMGHHMAVNMQHVRAVLDALTAETDGVHGASLLLYGEGWDFGEVAGNARGVNATQTNLAGSGIGTFNDRLRDAVRGGGPFDGGDTLVRAQGFGTGLGTLPNALTARADPDAQADAARRAADLVRVGLAGNLAAVTFVGADGTVVRGDEVLYNGQPAGYGLVPQDHIVYVSKHDNQTLWDIAQYKLPEDLPTEDRVRAHLVALSTVLYAQGTPFLHAGSDLLRSKSFDRNSYDAGDPFNAIDWTGATTTMGLGLPLAADNRDSWNVMRGRLANPLLQPDADDVAFAAAAVRDMLAVRAGTPLFRLRTADEIFERLAFHHTGPEATPGVIVLELRDDLADRVDLDPDLDRVVVVLNASPHRVNLDVPDAAGRVWRVHEVLRDGADAATLRGATIYAASGRATVPPLTTVVFVAPARSR
ncbi:MAG: pullulanase-type alpha-1,6-glucosidase, partial [Trueperaceae bacterium]|nr:pullulanase-type alpha-1,6-glucosidase [Trueperaceae bacterium]